MFWYIYVRERVVIRGTGWTKIKWLLNYFHVHASRMPLRVATLWDNIYKSYPTPSSSMGQAKVLDLVLSGDLRVTKSSMNMSLAELFIICTMEISYLHYVWCTIEMRGLYRNPR